MGGNKGTRKKGKGKKPLKAKSSKIEETKKDACDASGLPALESRRDHLEVEHGTLTKPADPQPFEYASVIVGPMELTKCNMVGEEKGEVGDEDKEDKEDEDDDCVLPTPQFMRSWNLLGKTITGMKEMIEGNMKLASDLLDLSDHDTDDDDDESMDDDTDQMEMDDDECPSTSPIPSVSNTSLIAPDSTALRGQKVVGVPPSVLKNERVRAVMKEQDPSLDLSKTKTLISESSKREEAKKNTTTMQRYSCYMCDDAPGLTTMESLRMHVLMYHLSMPEDPSFKCPKCPQTFDTKVGLHEHMTKIQLAYPPCHRGPVPVPAHIPPCCPPVVYQEDEETPLSFICDKCEVGFSNVWDFLQHTRNDGTCDLEKCPECNKNVERGMKFEWHKLSHEIDTWKFGNEGDEKIIDDDTEQTEMDIHEGPSTAPIPSVSNAPLIVSVPTSSMDTGLDGNAIIHIQPVETLRGQKLVALTQSLFKNERVRALMKELDPSLDFSKLEEDDIGVVGSEENEKDDGPKADDDHSTCQEPIPIRPVSEQETVCSAMNLCLPKTQLDYEDVFEKRQLAKIRRKYLFKGRRPADTQAVRAMRWNLCLKNPTAWTQLPQELKIDEGFFKTVKPVEVKAIEHKHAIDLCRLCNETIHL